MKILIAEDDFASRKYLFKLLSKYGDCDITVDGIETVEAFILGHELGAPYDALCLDIMMPKVDGLKALEAIRAYEEKQGIEEPKKCKVIITSALDKKEVEFESFNTGKIVYITKPFDAKIIEEVFKELELI